MLMKSILGISQNLFKLHVYVTTKVQTYLPVHIVRFSG